MSQNNGSPRPASVARLSEAEAGMIAQLHAVARVKAAAAAAQARLNAARQEMNAAAEEVASYLDLLAAEVAGELAADAAVQAAPTPPPVPVEPAPERFTFSCSRCDDLQHIDPFGIPTLDSTCEPCPECNMPLLGVPAAVGMLEASEPAEATPEPVAVPKPSRGRRGGKKVK